MDGKRSVSAKRAASASRAPAKRRAPASRLGRVGSLVLWFLQEFAYRGRTVVVVAVLLASLAIVGMLAWHHWSPLIASQEEYLLTPERILLPRTPPWLRQDVVAEAMEEAGLRGELSLLNDELVPRLVEALELHPWVREVLRVEKRYPARIVVELNYRLPIAAVETGGGRRPELCPVDKAGVRLPASDLPSRMLARLPRIADLGQLPLVGQPFEGPEIAQAIDLVGFLKDDWNRLYLLKVIPSERPEIRGAAKFYLFDLLTTGGTRIHWGAAPQAKLPQESPAEEKLQRLLGYIAEHGPLDTIESPSRIDVRNGLEAVPRVAERPTK